MSNRVTLLQRLEAARRRDTVDPDADWLRRRLREATERGADACAQSSTCGTCFRGEACVGSGADAMPMACACTAEVTALQRAETQVPEQQRSLVAES